MWQEELPLGFRVRDQVRTRCLQEVGVTGGVAIFRMGKGAQPIRREAQVTWV